jgi:hypothetical protein
MANVTPSGGRVRPVVVTYACYLLYLLAALQVISAIVQFSVLGTYSDIMKKAFADTSVGGTVATTTIAALAGTAVLGLLFAVGYVVLAVLDGRGKQAARIVTWVLLGLSLCCGGYGLIGNATGGFGGNTGSVEGAPSQGELQQMLKDGLPGWYQPVTLLLSVIGLLAAITVIILLALPASNPFFRKQQPVWEPPVPPTLSDQPGQQPQPEPQPEPQPQSPNEPPAPPVTGP